MFTVLNLCVLLLHHPLVSLLHCYKLCNMHVNSFFSLMHGVVHKRLGGALPDYFDSSFTFSSEICSHMCSVCIPIGWDFKFHTIQ